MFVPVATLCTLLHDVSAALLVENCKLSVESAFRSCHDKYRVPDSPTESEGDALPAAAGTFTGVTVGAGNSVTPDELLATPPLPQPTAAVSTAAAMSCAGNIRRDNNKDGNVAGILAVVRINFWNCVDA